MDYRMSDFEGVVAIDDKVCVEEYESRPEEKKVGSIIIPQSAGRKLKIGIVKSVGQLYRGGARPGMCVVYNEFTGAPVEIGDKNFLLLESDQIFGILVPRDARRETNA